MALEDQVVELKFRQKEVEQVLREQNRINQETADRFEAVERLISEQNEFLGAINVTLSKLQASFTHVMALADKWAQRVLGAGAMALILWVLFADAPLEKIKWLLGLFT